MDGPKGADYRIELHIGAGCCSQMNGWQRDIKPRRNRDINQPKIVKYTLDKVFAAFLRSLAREFVSSDLIFLTCHGMAHRLKEEGMADEEVEAILKEVAYHFTNNRSRFKEDFMG